LESDFFPSGRHFRTYGTPFSYFYEYALLYLQCLILRLNIIPYQKGYLRCISSIEAAYQEKRNVAASM